MSSTPQTTPGRKQARAVGLRLLAALAALAAGIAAVVIAILIVHTALSV